MTIPCSRSVFSNFNKGLGVMFIVGFFIVVQVSSNCIHTYECKRIEKKTKKKHLIVKTTMAKGR